MALLDEMLWRCVKNNPTAAISWYLAASYCYYCMDDSFISDGAYDKLARYLLKNYNTLKHPHKRLIIKEDLRCGSLQCAENKYPNIVKGAARVLLEKTRNKKR